MRTSSLCRVIIDPEPNSGAWNMAVDEALLEHALREPAATVRLYRWREATLSLGYFQNVDAGRAIPELAALPVVRRLTGGGAIVHHHELTYSLALPPSHPLARSPQRVYELVHRRIISVLGRHGVTAQLAVEVTGQGEEPFLCFGRRDRRDLVIAGYKVLGSAQRRRRGAILQHGSLLLRASAHAPGYAGIQELAQETLPADRLAIEIAAEIGHLLGPAETAATGITESERRRAGQLQAQRYLAHDWTGKRSSRSATTGTRSRSSPSTAVNGPAE